MVLLHLQRSVGARLAVGKPSRRHKNRRVQMSSARATAIWARGDYVGITRYNIYLLLLLLYTYY
jgi:hypothetical protein